MSEQKQVMLPITGMTCANCVATVERNLKKVNGVQSAVVNLSSERATVDFDPTLTGLEELIGKVQRAGYDVASGEADFTIGRLSDDNDARRLEKELGAMEGVLIAQVSFASERARVRYIPTLVSQAELRKKVAASGFLVLEGSSEMEDAEHLAREEEISKQRHLLLVGLIFTIPSSFFQWGATWVCCPNHSRMLAGLTG